MFTLPAGLTNIPRQIGLFPDFRAAMLAGIPALGALQGWRARRHDDYGLMLLEMWAYCCDVLAFYDETIAHECYLRTARQRTSLRRLTELLGYVPSPAMAASVMLAISLDGAKELTLPAGTAFRSAAFDGNAPQIFESDVAAVLYPQNNSWTLARPRPTQISGTVQSVILTNAAAAPAVDEFVMLEWGGNCYGLGRVKAKSQYTGADGETYQKVEFTSALCTVNSANLSSLKLKRPVKTAKFWSWPHVTGDDMSLEYDGRHITLDGVYKDILPGMLLAIEYHEERRWTYVDSVSVVMMQTEAVKTSSITCGSDTYTVTPAAVKVPATRIHLDDNLNYNIRGKKAADGNWDFQDTTEMTIFYDSKEVGTLTQESSPALTPEDELQLEVGFKAAEGASQFLMEDSLQTGVALGGHLDVGSGVLTPDQDTTWSETLTAPVKLYGNIVTASRGESVKGEIVGSGDASVSNQALTLKKKPLTYLASGSSTLKLYVDNVLWTEVSTFYGCGPTDRVYTVRLDEDGQATITGGDGVRGSRFTSGTNNVVAYYRFGAGADAPPAKGITQPAKPLSGVKSIANPVAASPGSDAQSTDNVRAYAPKSALLLGRAVSLQDLEAAAAMVSGVRAVASRWTWNHQRQQPVAQISCIGPDTVLESVRQSLQALADPTLPLDVVIAQALPRALTIAVDCDPLLEEQMLADLAGVLLNPESGLLAPENIGIGKPLYRSRVFDAVLSVAGALSVQAITWEGEPWRAYYPEKPVPGAYYDFEQGSVTVNGKAVVYA